MVFILAFWMDLGAWTLFLHSEWTWVNGLCNETENYLRVCLKTKDLAYPHQLPLRDSITAVIWNGISFVFITVFIMLAAWRLIIQCCDPDCGRKIHLIHFILVPKEKEPFLRERERGGAREGEERGGRERERKGERDRGLLFLRDVQSVCANLQYDHIYELSHCGCVCVFSTNHVTEGCMWLYTCRNCMI